ncbi:MAG: gentisate 1,2-dioxygenase [Blastomonas sp. CACIA14H2]|nr:MAG: gentisate 1,2-dioxygenase [Blastomonas sp. CACIA14H2]
MAPMTAADPSGSNEQRAQLESLYAAMAPKGLLPLWESLHSLVPAEPASPSRPWRWRYAEVRDLLLRAGDIISAEQAERRVLIMENPGLPGLSAITPSLYAGLQLILPGEIAPCHRHTQNALRFVMEGSGAFTALDGEKAIMQPFDLVLTPAGQWHDHGNETSEPMIWLDGLDIPTVRLFDASFAERLGAAAHPQTVPPGDSLARYGRNLRPMKGTAADRRPAARPLFHYRHADWRPSLEAMARSADIDPHFGHALEFLNPADGGSILSTISAHVRLLPAGFESRRRQATDGTVFVVVEGEGTLLLGDDEIKLEPRDVMVVPSWVAHRFQARTQMILFGYSDKAAQTKLDLYRECNH